MERTTSLHAMHLQPSPTWYHKKICDDNLENDQDACYEQFGNGFKGGGFASNLRGCLAWAEVRRNACYRGERDPGPYRGGDSWPGGRNR